MKLVNETQQSILYDISAPGMGDCGMIDVDGLVDLPGYDNKSDVSVSFRPTSGQDFSMTIPKTSTGEQVEIALLVE